MAAPAGRIRKGVKIMRKFTLIANCILFIALFMVWTLRPTSAGHGGDDERRIERGFDIAPVALDLKGKNPALVGLGSYIVNAQAACNDCHTRPPYAEGGDPFQGSRRGLMRQNTSRAGGSSAPSRPPTSRPMPRGYLPA